MLLRKFLCADEALLPPPSSSTLPDRAILHSVRQASMLNLTQARSIVSELSLSSMSLSTPELPHITHPPSPNPFTLLTHTAQKDHHVIV